MSAILGVISSLLLVWQALLGVRSAKHRHQSPEWTILSHSYRLIQGEIVDLRSCWMVIIHIVQGRPGGLLQFSESDGEAVMILLASVSSGILAIWPNRERRRAWTIADRTYAHAKRDETQAFYDNQNKPILWHTENHMALRPDELQLHS